LKSTECLLAAQAQPDFSNLQSIVDAMRRAAKAHAYEPNIASSSLGLGGVPAPGPGQDGLPYGGVSGINSWGSDHGQAIKNDLRDGFHALPDWMRVIVRDLLPKANSERGIKRRSQKPSDASSHKQRY
jgi:hypothetical protein